jgi:hypothetical protein
LARTVLSGASVAARVVFATTLRVREQGMSFEDASEPFEVDRVGWCRVRVKAARQSSV